VCVFAGHTVTINQKYTKNETHKIRIYKSVVLNVGFRHHTDEKYLINPYPANVENRVSSKIASK
jgi:hypothetical protein